jgi:DNA-binding NarL/FixJ family response regulator
MQQPNELGPRPIVLLLDDLPLRRAAAEALLRSWAESFGASIELGETSSLETSAEPLSGKAMVVVNVGGASLSHPELEASLRLLVGRAARTPIVVVSDTDDLGEMVRAFEAGVRGFVPASTAPDLALKALTFILNGGHFFPPSVLYPTARRSRHHPGTAPDMPSPDLPSKPGRGLRHAVRFELHVGHAAGYHPPRILRVLVRFRGASRYPGGRWTLRARTGLQGQLSQLSRSPLRKTARKGSIM